MKFRNWYEVFGTPKLPFWTSCPHTYEWVIHFLSNHSETVSWKEFAQKTDWEDEVAGLGYRIPGKPQVNRGGLGLYLHKDWSVSFDKVDPAAVNGQEIYFFTWSGMEYIFCNDAGRQALLANARAEWGEEAEEGEEGEE